MKTTLTACFICMLSIPSLFAQTDARSLKYDFFTPVGGCMGFSLEKPKNDFISYDYDLGMIGLRLGDYFDYDAFFGGYAAFGPRMYFKRDDAAQNDMRGLYFKPILMLNYFVWSDSSTYYDYLTGAYYADEVSGSDFTINLLASMGSQWILSDLIVFDLWFGLGYGGGWNTYESDLIPESYFGTADRPFKYSYTRFGYSPLIFDGGLSIGFKF